MLEQVIKEVKAPKPVQQLIDQFVLDISKFIKKCQFPKTSSPSQLSNLPLKLADQTPKFPGAKNPISSAIGPLKTKSLGKDSYKLNKIHTGCPKNKLKSLKVAQSKDDDGGGVVNACMNDHVVCCCVLLCVVVCCCV